MTENILTSWHFLLNFQEDLSKIEDELSCVYAIVNITIQRIYIGSTINLRKRIMQHRSALRIGSHINKNLFSDYKLIGEATFNIYLIKKGTQEEIRVFEVEEIKNFHHWELYNALQHPTSNSKIKIHSDLGNENLLLKQLQDSNEKYRTQILELMSMTKVKIEKITGIDKIKTLVKFAKRDFDNVLGFYDYLVSAITMFLKLKIDQFRAMVETDYTLNIGSLIDEFGSLQTMIDNTQFFDMFYIELDEGKRYDPISVLYRLLEIKESNES